MELRHGPYSYGRQQWGILRNGRKPDVATPRERRSLLGCKVLSAGTKKMTVPAKEASANYVPAAAVRRRMQALSGFIGRKEFRRRFVKSGVKDRGSTPGLHWILADWSVVEVSGISGVAVKCVDIRKNTGGEGDLLGHN